jgi:hypothetical protein
MKITSSIVAQLSAARQGLEKRFGPMEEAEAVEFTEFARALSEALTPETPGDWGCLNRAINAVQSELWRAMRETGTVDALPDEASDWHELVAWLDELPPVMVKPAMVLFDIAWHLGLSEAELREAVGDEIYWLLTGEEAEVNVEPFGVGAFVRIRRVSYHRPDLPGAMETFLTVVDAIRAEEER